MSKMSKSLKLMLSAAALLLITGLAYTMLAANYAKDDEQVGSSRIETVASGLDTPWKAVVLPSKDLLVTERSGQLERIGNDQRTYPVAGVYETSEGGLMGLALHPRFQDNNWLYVYLTSKEGARIVNRVERYRYEGDRLHDRKVIIDDIPGAQVHDGGALAFGPDGLLYAATGDAQDESAAQDTNSLAGKILHVTDEGEIPPDNPFGNAVYSYGHRNPQGLAWDDQGRLWATEHGRSGFDELNLIEKDANYGWPVIQGDATRPDMKAPAAHSGADTTWAPSGLAYAEGSLYFAGLRGKGVYQAKLQPDGDVRLSKHLDDTFGRLRGVTADGNSLLVTTSNRDGRGNPIPSDDRILRVPLSEVQEPN